MNINQRFCESEIQFIWTVSSEYFHRSPYPPVPSVAEKIPNIKFHSLTIQARDEGD